MADETYYSLLGVSERASDSEIKAAYRNLIKQVHPDTISGLPAYLRALAEEKSKELTEAYSVLSNTSKRRQYDTLISSYRHPQGQSKPPQNNSQPTTNPPPSKHSPAYSRGRKWVMWVRKHPFATGLAALLMLIVIIAIGASSPTSPTPSTLTPAERFAAAKAGIEKRAADDPVRRDLADANQTSQMDRKFRGMYIGTVHNASVNLTAPIRIVTIEQSNGAIEGCAAIDLPLYGSGKLLGRRNGNQVTFSVQNINFVGTVSESHSDGSYVVSYPDAAQQTGDFHIVKQQSIPSSVHCSNGILLQNRSLDRTAEVASRSSTTDPSPKTTAGTFATVSSRSAVLNKRCAFLPFDNYGRCGYGPETVAELKLGDRLRVLSAQTRAEDGTDILKVRTDQGWVGWIDSSKVYLDAK